MENYEVLPGKVQAKYDDLRFPKIWHALLGVAVMYVPVYTVAFISSILLAMFNDGTLFNTEFGEYMLNGVISQFFGILIIPLFMILVTRRDMGSTLRLKKNIDILQVLLLGIFSLGIFFILQIANNVFISTASGFLGEPSESTSVDALNLTQLMFEIVIVAGLPAICEEIFFRGYVMRAFERKSKIQAILMSAIIFAIMHGNFKQLVYAFLCGIILGSVVMLTDSLFAGCVVHFTLNATTVLFNYPPINNVYMDIVTKYEYIFSSIVVLVLPVIALGAMALFIIYTLKKNKKHYGLSVPSEMNYASLMPSEKSGAKTILWIAFIVINVIFMLSNW